MEGEGEGGKLKGKDYYFHVFTFWHKKWGFCLLNVNMHKIIARSKCLSHGRGLKKRIFENNVN